MVGSPLEEASWNAVEGAYYTGAGSGELVWLVLSIVCCVIAMIKGHAHESTAYNDAEKRSREQ